MKCFKCNREVLQDSEFCSSCGTYLLDSEMTYEEKVLDYVKRLRGRYARGVETPDQELADRYLEETEEELYGRDLLTSVKRFLSITRRGFRLEESKSMTDVELLDMIRGTVRKYGKRFCPHCVDDDEDIAMDIYLHFKTKKFMERYDPAVCEIHYFVWMGCRNYLIDQERKMNRIDEYSYDEEYSTPNKEIILHGALPGTEEKEYELLYDLIEQLDDTPLGEAKETPIGELVPSEQSIMKLYLEAYKPTEVGQMFEMSRIKVKRMMDKAIEKLQQYVQNREVVFVDSVSGISSNEVGELISVFYPLYLSHAMYEENIENDYYINQGVKYNTGSFTLEIPWVCDNFTLSETLIKKTLMSILYELGYPPALVDQFWNTGVQINTTIEKDSCEGRCYSLLYTFNSPLSVPKLKIAKNAYEMITAYFLDVYEGKTGVWDIYRVQTIGSDLLIGVNEATKEYVNKGEIYITENLQAEFARIGYKEGSEKAIQDSEENIEMIEKLQGMYERLEDLRREKSNLSENNQSVENIEKEILELRKEIEEMKLLIGEE